MTKELSNGLYSINKPDVEFYSKNEFDKILSVILRKDDIIAIKLCYYHLMPLSKVLSLTADNLDKHDNKCYIVLRKKSTNNRTIIPISSKMYSNLKQLFAIDSHLTQRSSFLRRLSRYCAKVNVDYKGSIALRRGGEELYKNEKYIAINNIRVDDLQVFLDTYYEFTKIPNDCIRKDNIYEHYREYCNRYNITRISDSVFGRRLIEHGVTSEQRRDPDVPKQYIRLYRGIIEKPVIETPTKIDLEIKENDQYK